MLNSRNRNRRKHSDFEENFEKIKQKKNGCDNQVRSWQNKPRFTAHQNEFKCKNCGYMVDLRREISGVNNRNHCPYCLWSLHVDLVKPGDRRASCKGRMEPVGLTVKHTLKRYGNEKPGELMIIHLCLTCGKHSINRISGDDTALKLMELFDRSRNIPKALSSQLAAEGILLLGPRDLTLVHSQLFGWQAILTEFREEAPSIIEVLNNSTHDQDQ